MKKLGIITAVILVIGAVLFVWLLGQSSPDNADSTQITVDVPDNFEK